AKFRLEPCSSFSYNSSACYPRLFSIFAYATEGEFKPENVEGTPQEAITIPPRTEWRFDGSVPSPSGEKNPATLDWQAFREVTDLQVRDGRLVGHCMSTRPLIRVEMTSRPDDTDLLHSVEVRMCASAGANLYVGMLDDSNDVIDWLGTPIVGDSEIRTYEIKTRWAPQASNIKRVGIRPTDANEATFEIEHVRLIFRKEYLASIPSGLTWQGLSKIYRQTLVAKTPEVIQFPLTLPDRPWFDLALGTVDDGSVTFQVKIRSADGPAEDVALLKRTITTPRRWEPVQVDLSEYARQDVILSLSLAGEKAGTLGFWGSPVIRNSRIDLAPPTSGKDALPKKIPQGVILIWADDLRWDHLDVYGYSRKTAPVLSRMASEGTLFHDCLSQGPWTLPSTVSLLTSLYPTTHGVYAEGVYARLLPASATSLAEVFHDASYATLSFVSMPYTGQRYKLDQGFEELHGYQSTVNPEGSNDTARPYIDRLLPWLEVHREVPFFVFLHVLDPHALFEPRSPYNALWADPAAKGKERTYLKKVGLTPTPKQLKEAGTDPNYFISLRKDWYDGSIRAMDTEIGRLFERLEELGLDDKTLVIFCSDHGEEFYDHGKLGHYGAYSEVTHVPLIIRWPGVIPKGTEVYETVRTIDLMPTILELCHLPVPEVVQGQSLLPLFATARRASDESVAISDRSAESTAVQWRKEIAVCEHLHSEREKIRNPENRDLYAIILDGWKLNYCEPLEGEPEYELYDHRKDPLDQV
ncbi:MAG: sulfatase, partial [Planctomycetota bacterium]